MKKHLPSRNTTGFGTMTTNNSSLKSKVMTRPGMPEANNTMRPASQAIDSECYRLRKLQGVNGGNNLNNAQTASSNLQGDILPQNLGRMPDLKLNVQSHEGLGLDAAKNGQFHTAKNNRRGKTTLHAKANSFGGANTPGG